MIKTFFNSRIKAHITANGFMLYLSHSGGLNVEGPGTLVSPELIGHHSTTLPWPKNLWKVWSAILLGIIGISYRSSYFFASWLLLEPYSYSSWGQLVIYHADKTIGLHSTNCCTADLEISLYINEYRLVTLQIKGVK